MSAHAYAIDVTTRAIERIAQQRLWPDFHLLVVRAQDDHWLWMGDLNEAGYGVYEGALAHRIAFQSAISVPPLGWHIHHICGVKPCVNPAHMQALHPCKHTYIARCSAGDEWLKAWEEGEYYTFLLRAYGGDESQIDLDAFYRRIYGSKRAKAARRAT